MFNYLFARHRRTYISLGWKYKMNPERIYKLAHGSKIKTEKDKKIIHELLALDIVHRHVSDSHF